MGYATRFLLVPLALVACGGQLAGEPPDASSFDATPKPKDAASEPVLPSCSKTSCNGCCDSNGVCHDGAEAISCGKGGGACVDCAAQGLVCAAMADGGGTCASAAKVTCTPQNCAGCCEGNTCLAGTSIGACGVGGASCVGCPLEAACLNGSCVIDTTSCSAANCVGCCIGNTCYAGTDNALCGQNGAKCQNCFGNGACHQTGPLGGGVCTTSAGCNCPTGCCDGFLQCHTGDEAIACGGGGSQCGVCSNGGACVGNACTLGTCDAQSCAGCCDDFGVCHATSDLQHCGGDGDRCVACPSGYACQGGGCVVAPPCGPSNCSGCCDANGNCSTGTTSSACGSGGAACVACTGTTQCLLQVCQ